MTPRERAAEKIVIAILKCGACPNIIPKNADCDYPECRDSMCKFWQRGDAIKEQVGVIITEHVHELLADDATRLAIQSAVMGANRWLPAGCSNVEAAGEIADQVSAALRRKGGE